MGFRGGEDSNGATIFCGEVSYVPRDQSLLLGGRGHFQKNGIVWVGSGHAFTRLGNEMDLKGQDGEKRADPVGV